LADIYRLLEALQVWSAKSSVESAKPRIELLRDIEDHVR